MTQEQVLYSNMNRELPQWLTFTHTQLPQIYWIIIICFHTCPRMFGFGL